MNFYIADCHFGHENILAFDRRPFADVQEMEEVMVARWNGAVGQQDTVYILGDFCIGQADEWLRILGRLQGKKVLIRGNHDPEHYSPALKGAFADILSDLVVTDHSESGKARRVILSHYPMLFYKHANIHKYYMLCGHVHSTAENDWLEKWTRELQAAKAENPDGAGINCGQICNVGAMMPWMDYTPRTLDDLLNRWQLWHRQTLG